MSTLYVSDLDGTLLTSDSRISAKSARIINHLTAHGVLFSVATARNIGTAFNKVQPLHLRAPISLMNGVFLYRQNDPKPLRILPFPEEQAHFLLQESLKAGASPFLYTYDRSDYMLYLTYRDLDFPARKQFYGLRKHVPYKKFRLDPTFQIEKNCIPVYINFLDHYDTLLQVYKITEKLQGIQSVFYRDPVLNAWYLEVFSSEAGKAAGARQIAEYVGADRMVAFGDNNNDLSMFAVADESYATANAAAEIRGKADAVIPSCDDDGVAIFLRDRFRQYF